MSIGRFRSSKAFLGPLRSLQRRFSSVPRRNAAIPGGSTIAKVLLAGTVVYTGSAFFALENYRFSKVFEQYFPLGAQVLDFLEEREHRKVTLARHQYYESQRPLTPYIKSQRPKTDEDDSELSKPDITTDKYDPLAPDNFFDAQSGTVATTGEREYLPLVLLPDTSDPVVNDVAFALNDLISSVNSSAVDPSTVVNVSQRLEKLAHSVHDLTPTYSSIFHFKARLLQQLVDSQQSLREKYGDKLPKKVLAVYLKRLSRIILETENDLVAHVNTRGQFETEANRRVQNEKKSLLVSEADSLEAIIQLQLSFSLLISALHSKSAMPIAPYIQRAKEAIANFPDRTKEQIVASAISGLRVPDDVDLQPIVKDICR
ncbi:hypothetical protein TRVA0_070S00364 [Trichomonascus vanleenenianus]|uniref:uncharacterized protein n=1 Tax=Trichomonascus vanleenenianus TaxID=2268995 RepID=UPI003EC9660C